MVHDIHVNQNENNNEEYEVFVFFKCVFFLTECFLNV